jgi:ABC-type sugar transport system ATPase subunit
MTDGDGEPVVRMSGIRKRFGRVVALDGVDFEVDENEIVGVLGDNGAGKSTLANILSGFHRPDEGEIRINGEQVSFNNPTDARKYGIEAVYQDLALVDSRDIKSNIFLGRAPRRKLGGLIPVVDWTEMQTRASEILRDRFDLDVDMEQNRVEHLSGGERQAVAIARALVTDPDVVLLDEPVSALSPDLARRVLDLVQDLRDEGKSIVLITHSLEEVFDFTDRIVVLYNGRRVGGVSTDSVTESDVTQMIVEGQMPGELAPSEEPTGV